jgi:RNA 3'-terminal phosphate cyclase (ATP)
MIKIDGSMMEGGGQLLRMATTYSAILSEPIKVINVRAKRREPGLKPQHLTTLKAAATICNAKMKGGALGSTEIIFEPKRIKGDVYNFNIGTAGSITLLLQCITPMLIYADKPSNITIQGGTAVNWSPSFSFLKNIIYQSLQSMGAKVNIRIEKHGFYPKGGGKITQTTYPSKNFKPIIPKEPKKNKIVGESLCGRLPKHIAKRQAQSAQSILEANKLESQITYGKIHPAPLSPGSLICLWVKGTNIYLGADKLGARGKPAEKVGAEVATRIIEEVNTKATVDRHTTDNLILPASLASGTSYLKTSKITLHTLTAIEVAKIFTETRFTVKGKINKPGTIKIQGIKLENRENK